jgi:hypothetical protein
VQYRSEEPGGLLIERLYKALHAEGATQVDRPGSTCPLNLLPLFQEPRKELSRLRICAYPGCGNVVVDLS